MTLAPQSRPWTASRLRSLRSRNSSRSSAVVAGPRPTPSRLDIVTEASVGAAARGRRGHHDSRCTQRHTCAELRASLAFRGQVGSASRVAEFTRFCRPTAMECPLAWSGRTLARCRQCSDNVGSSLEDMPPHSESVPSNPVWPFPRALPTAQCCGPAPEPAQPQQLTMSHAAATRGVVTRIPTLLSKASQPFVTNEAWA